MLYQILALLIWGSSFIAAKYSYEMLDPALMVEARLLIAALMVLPSCRRHLGRIPRSEWKPLLWISFVNYVVVLMLQFIGLKNYTELFGDSIFQKALKNTLIIVLVSVPTVAIFSLWVASAIYKMKGPVLSAFRCIFYLPVVTGSVAVTVVWKWMFHNYYGLFNYVGTHTGVLEKNINWLGDARFALPCIILILFTTSVGQPIVLYVSALGNVDDSLVEAASVDGATNLQLFWKIKWPQIMPTTLYILVITTINSFQCFALIQLLTSGGPNHSTDTVMYYIYYTAFKLYRYGYGNAMGVILAIIIALLSALQFQLAKEK